MNLFHVSEDPNIKEFVPLPPPTPDAGVEGNAVWAINDQELSNYLLPRDCPRICYYNEQGKKVITIEESWIERIKQTTLYLYVFSKDKFEELDPIAGYWISRETIQPKSILKIKNLINELEIRGVLLKRLAHLHNEKEFVLKNHKNFSIIRFKNATPP